MENLIDEYLAGPESLRQAIRGMTPEQVNASPIAGKWSTRQILCHIADTESLYAERMKRVIAEERPTMFAVNPDQFAAKLAYNQRDMAEELQLVEMVRCQMARVLRTLNPDDFQRTGNHSERGPLTLAQLLTSVTGHIPHHIRFIDEKRAAM